MLYRSPHLPSTGQDDYTVPRLQTFWAQPPWLAYITTVLAITFVAEVTFRVHDRAFRYGRPLKHHRAIMPMSYSFSSVLIGTQVVRTLPSASRASDTA